MAYGRGGAGNILQAKEESKKDVEVSAHQCASRTVQTVPLNRQSNERRRTSKQIAHPLLPQLKPPSLRPIKHPITHTWVVEEQAIGTSPPNFRRKAPSPNPPIPPLYPHLPSRRSVHHGTLTVKRCRLRDRGEVVRGTFCGGAMSKCERRGRVENWTS